MLQVSVYPLLFFFFWFGSGTSDAFVNSDSNDARGLAVSMDMSSYGGGLNLTVDACVDACSSAGYAMAGVELATQCCMCRLLDEPFLS